MHVGFQADWTGQVKEPIHKVTLQDGSTRYRLVVDAPRDADGKRKQITRTFDTQREARDELSRIRHETNQGSYVRPSKETLSSYLDDYLKGATRRRRAWTKRNYQDALRPVRERLGTRTLQSITKADIAELVDWMLTSGRRRGGNPGTGLSGRSVRLTLGRLTADLESAVLEGKVVRNIARLVVPPEHVQRDWETWIKAEVKKSRLHGPARGRGHRPARLRHRPGPAPDRRPAGLLRRGRQGGPGHPEVAPVPHGTGSPVPGPRAAPEAIGGMHPDSITTTLDLYGHLYPAGMDLWVDRLRGSRYGQKTRTMTRMPESRHDDLGRSWRARRDSNPQPSDP